MSAGTLAVAGTAASADPPDGTAKKVFVCKYVGTPGVNERLQTGGNPINASVNAINDYQGVGSYFGDAHERSYVLVEDTGQPEPAVSQCPTPDAPTPVTAPVPSVTPASCDAAGLPVFPSFDHGHWVLSDNGLTGTPVADEEYELTNPGAVTVHPDAQLTGEQCAVVPPTDVCEDLPGDQPEGFPCTMAPEVKVVTSEGRPDCVTLRVALFETTTTTPFKLEEGAWVLDTANAGTEKVSTGFRDADEQECATEPPSTNPPSMNPPSTNPPKHSVVSPPEAAAPVTHGIVAVPTAVEAGLAGSPTVVPAVSSGTSGWPLIGAGLAFLMAAGVLLTGRKNRGRVEH